MCEPVDSGIPPSAIPCVSFFVTPVAFLSSGILSFLFKDNQQLPVIPQNKQVTFKTSLNDRLANYTLEFKFAYDKLNTIR